ncbi:MAG: META domain-containing protein [Caldilineaceae bacterium]
MKHIRLFSLIIILLLAACAPIQANLTPVATPETPTPDATSSANSGDSLVNTSWQLISLGPSTAPADVLPESTITLEFKEAGEMGGNGGCNTYGGSYSVEGDTLALQQVVSTLMACADMTVTNQEQAYLQALGTVERFELSGDSLTLWYDSGNSVLNFTTNLNAPTLPEATPITPTADLPSVGVIVW